MRLNAAQLRKVEEHFGVEAVPEEHSAQPQLKEAFGDHTFFIDAAGLNIIEPETLKGDTEARVVRLASWSSEDQNELVGHYPQFLDATVDIGPDVPPLN